MKTMTMKPLNGAFLSARNELAKALADLAAAQAEFGELMNHEAKLTDELNALTVKATDAGAVEKKAALQRQIAECRSQSRTIETKRLPKARETLSKSLSACVDPYREQLGKEILVAKGRLVRVLKEYYHEESRAIEVAERSDRIGFLIFNLR